MSDQTYDVLRARILLQQCAIDMRSSYPDREANRTSTAAADALFSFRGRCDRSLFGLDQIRAARGYEIWRMPESFEPSGKQPFLDVQELSQLLLAPKKQGSFAEDPDVRIVDSCAHARMMVTTITPVCSISYITSAGLHVVSTCAP